MKQEFYSQNYDIHSSYGKDHFLWYIPFVQDAYRMCAGGRSTSCILRQTSVPVFFTCDNFSRTSVHSVTVKQLYNIYITQIGIIPNTWYKIKGPWRQAHLLARNFIITYLLAKPYVDKLLKRITAVINITGVYIFKFFTQRNLQSPSPKLFHLPQNGYHERFPYSGRLEERVHPSAIYIPSSIFHGIFSGVDS
jgi:hypothetical protein